jgi:hypothetical protein
MPAGIIGRSLFQHTVPTHGLLMMDLHASQTCQIFSPIHKLATSLVKLGAHPHIGFGVNLATGVPHF